MNEEVDISNIVQTEKIGIRHTYIYTHEEGTHVFQTRTNIDERIDKSMQCHEVECVSLCKEVYKSVYTAKAGYVKKHYMCESVSVFVYMYICEKGCMCVCE